ncbi:phosphoglycerate mutase [Gluconobacter potus]|uniref:Phosphoglycerate mutase n=1 Tax=Gluconobacter potus TaxID=2724927 RepID=A0A149QTE1_9PROT|nr:histidine phosphatase family protein [Gluconobacter potus]KXV00579.1 phosphoglycerate mutase [Gluconobacter potus]
MSQIAPKPYWYLRHGETDWNRQGLAQGRTDIPLNETGRQQALQAGRILASLFENGQKPFARIVSSPLTRAFVTAETVQKTIQDCTGIAIPLHVDDNLKEVCFGIQEGTPMGDWYRPWIEDGLTPEDAESFRALTDRARLAVNHALENPDIPLIVAHGALFRELRHAMNLPVDIRLPNAVPVALKFTRTGWQTEMLDPSIPATNYTHTHSRDPLEYKSEQ